MSNKDPKDRLIETTKRLIQKQSKITIKDITDKAFVNVAAVNYHFGSKDNLINLVVGDIIKEFKKEIFEAITAIPEDQSPETTLRLMLDLLYEFVLENIVLLNYILINFSTDSISSNLIIDEFLNDNEFTKLVLLILETQSGITDPNRLMARYMLIFSSFVIPLFIELIQVLNPNDKIKYSWRDNTLLKDSYIKELINLLGI